MMFLYITMLVHIAGGLYNSYFLFDNLYQFEHACTSEISVIPDVFTCGLWVAVKRMICTQKETDCYRKISLMKLAFTMTQLILATKEKSGCIIS